MTRRSQRPKPSVPKPQALRASAPLSVADVVKDNASKPARILIDVARAEGQADHAVRRRADRAIGRLPLPEPVDGAPDPRHKRFAVVLDGMPSGASAKGATLKITAVSGGQAIETAVPLD